MHTQNTHGQTILKTVFRVIVSWTNTMRWSNIWSNHMVHVHVFGQKLFDDYAYSSRNFKRAVSILLKITLAPITHLAAVGWHWIRLNEFECNTNISMRRNSCSRSFFEYKHRFKLVEISLRNILSGIICIVVMV